MQFVEDIKVDYSLVCQKAYRLYMPVQEFSEKSILVLPSEYAAKYSEKDYVKREVPLALCDEDTRTVAALLYSSLNVKVSSAYLVMPRARFEAGARWVLKEYLIGFKDKKGG